MSKTNKISVKDYFHLAKQSIKSRKKSTRTTVAGIAFGLILIIPVLYFTFSFYMDFTTKINKVPTVSMFNVSTTLNESVDYASSSDNYQAYVVRGTNTVNDMLKATKQKDIVYFNQYAFSQNNILIKFNNNNKKPLSEAISYNPGNTQYNGQISINGNTAPQNFYALDYEKSNGKFVNDSIKDFLKTEHNTTYLASGTEFTAQTKGKGEILVSQKFAKHNNVKVGDKVSMSYEGESRSTNMGRIDNDSNPDNVYDYKNLSQEDYQNPTYYDFEFMRNFVIVGTISDAYYTNIATADDPHFFITTESITASDGSLYAPQPKMATYTNTELTSSFDTFYCLMTYKQDVDILCDEAIKNGKMALPHGIATFIGNYNDSYWEVRELAPISKERIVRVQFNDYASASKASKFLDSRMKATNTEIKDYNYLNTVFATYKTMNMVGTIVISVFLVFGGVILFATMVNLYNSIQYSVESRRNYMGMLRAVGAKNDVLNKMYFTEVILIFLKSLPWVVIFGGGICIGIKFAIDALFISIKGFFSFSLSLSLWYIPLVFAIMFAFAFLTGVIYSRICCKPLTKRGILTLLKEDR